jgi:hypothetical protein
MDLSTLVLVAVGIATLGYLAWPFVRRNAPPSLRTQQDVFADALETEKYYVYRSILDLDTDFKAGKIDAAEHHRLREGLMAEAARLLAQIDGVQTPHLSPKKA